MTSATNYRITSTPLSVGPPVRLSLSPPARRDRVLDGGWWPRSWHPGAELPGLITTINASRDVVTEALLHVDAWSPRPHRLVVDGRVLHLTWSRTIEPGLIIVVCADGTRLRLLVIPPHANMTHAAAALVDAADAANTRRASEILLKASIPAPVLAVVDGESESVWATDGGRNLC